MYGCSGVRNYTKLGKLRPWRPPGLPHYGRADWFEYTRFSISLRRSPLGVAVVMMGRMGCAIGSSRLRSLWNQHNVKRQVFFRPLEALPRVRPSLTYPTPTGCQIRRDGRPLQPHGSDIDRRADRVSHHITSDSRRPTQARRWV